jgi:hypothetical protein
VIGVLEMGKHIPEGPSVSEQDAQNIYNLLEKYGYVKVLARISADMGNWIQSDVAEDARERWVNTRQKLDSVIVDLRRLKEI